MTMGWLRLLCRARSLVGRPAFSQASADGQGVRQQVVAQAVPPSHHGTHLAQPQLPTLECGVTAPTGLHRRVLRVTSLDFDVA